MRPDQQIWFYYEPKPDDCKDGIESPVKPSPNGSYTVLKPNFAEMI